MRRGSSSESSKIFLRVLKGMSPTLPHFRSWVKAWTTAALPPELCVQRAPRVPPRVRLFRLLSWFRSSPSSTAPSDDREKLSVLSSLSPQSGRATLHPSLARVRRRRERSLLVTNLEWKKRFFNARAFSPPKFARSRGRRPRRA